MTIPTIAEIRDQILADIQSGLGATEPLLPRSAWGILATAVAGAVALVYRFAAWAQKQIFTQTADIDALVLRAAEYGLTRTPAQGWAGTATITGVDGTFVPAGTLWQSGDFVYRSKAAVSISGSTTVEIESVATGDATNLADGEVIALVTPQTGVEREATVASTTQTGEDVESVEDFRTRILQRQRAIPQGGAVPDWIGWSTEVAGISEAFIDRPSAGVISVYPVTDDANPENRIPTPAKIAEVESYLGDPKRSPIRADQINVVAPTEVVFDIAISGLIPDTASMRAGVVDAITAHLYGLRPKQYADEPDPRDIVSEAKVLSVIVKAGADAASVSITDGSGTPVSSYQLSIGELAKLGGVTWT